MTPETVIVVGQEALKITIMLAAPLLLSALAIGLLVGMFQAATQIQEMTLSFIPKLGIMALVLAVGGPCMLRLVEDCTERLFSNIPATID